MPQHACTFKVNCCLKIHNAHLKLLSPISGYVSKVNTVEQVQVVITWRQNDTEREREGGRERETEREAERQRETERERERQRERGIDANINIAIRKELGRLICNLVA